MNNREIEEYCDLDYPNYPELESVQDQLPRVKQTYARENKILGRCGGAFCDAEISAFAKTADETFYICEFGAGGTVLYCSESCAMSDVMERGFGWSDIQMATKCQQEKQ